MRVAFLPFLAVLKLRSTLLPAGCQFFRMETVKSTIAARRELRRHRFRTVDAP